MMKGYSQHIVPAFLLVFLLLAFIVIANPTADYQPPSEPDSIHLNRNYTFINISTNESAVDYILLEWNGTNVTIDSPQLLLNMHFNENNTASRVILDSSRYGMNGTLRGGSPVFTNSGKFGTGWVFNGSDTTAMINISNMGNLLRFNETGEFTVMAWAQVYTNFSHGHFVRFSGITAGHFLGFYGQSGGGERPKYLCFEVRNTTDTGYYLCYTYSALADGDWHHYTGTVKAGAFQSLFIDGVMVANASAADRAKTISASTSIQIGGPDWSSGIQKSVNGTIDEVRIYNRSMTAQEINATYKAELGRYNTTQFFANMTDLNNGQYQYVTIINNTAGAINRSQARIVSIGGFAVDFLSPTETNNTYLNRNYTFLNISSNDPNIDYLLTEWNGTNVTIDSPQLLLSMNFADAYYNVSSKNVTDASRYGNNGTYIGEVFNNGTLNGAAWNSSGKYGTALSFDGVNDYVDLGSSSALLPVNTLTLEAWVNPKLLGSIATVLSKGINSPYYGWEISKRGGNEWRGKITVGGVVYDAISDNTYTQNKWVHLAVTYDNATLRLYVDGVLQGTTASVTGDITYTGTKNPVIGTWSPGDTTEIFNGTIDEVRIYNYALTGEEINASMNSRYPVNRTIASYRFEEGSGNTAYDMHHQLAGRFGGGVGFDGINDYIAIPNSGSLNFSSNEFTVGLWFSKAATTLPSPSYHTIIASEDDYNNNDWWGIWSINTDMDNIQFGTRKDGFSNATNFNNNFNLNEWHYITMTKNGTNATLLVDGMFKKSVEVHAALNPTVQPIYIMGNTGAGGNRANNGSVDEIRIWNRTLSGAEINATYKAQFGKYNATQFYANFTDLDDGQYRYVVILNNTDGALNRSQERIVNVDVACSPPDSAGWNISKACIFSGRNVSTAYNLTLSNGGNLTLVNSNITFNGTNQYIFVFNRSSLVVNSGSKIGK